MIQYSSINDAWGNKKTLNNIEKNIAKPSVNYQIQDEKEIITPVIEKKNHDEKFVNKQSQCSFTEHLKTCENCKKIMVDYFTNNENNIKKINIFGLIKFNLTTDVLKVIFIILIIIIFILLLSMMNISLKTNNIGMKYYMVPNNIPNIPNIPGIPGIAAQYFSN